MAKNKLIVKDVNDFNVDIADNGFVLNYSGQDGEDNWQSAKVVVNNQEQLFEELVKVIAMKG